MKPNYTQEQYQQLLTLLETVKKNSDIYKKANNAQKIRVFDLSAPTVDALVELGYYRDFAESLIMFGKDFLNIPSMINNPLYRTMFPESYKLFNL